MKHYLILTSSFPICEDGSEAAGSFVYDFAKELGQKAKITVICPGSNNSVYFSESIETIVFDVPITPLSDLNLKNPSHYFAIIKTIYLGYKKTYDVCKKNDITHILCFWILPSGLWAYLAKKRLKYLNYSCWALGSDIWKFSKNRNAKRLINKILLASNHCFADGYELQNNIESIFDVKCHFLASSRNIPAEEFDKSPPSDQFKIAYLGRWHQNKGVDILLNALYQLPVNYRNKIYSIRIAGGGPLKNLVEDKCIQLSKVGYHVELNGYLNSHDAAELISWADYLVIPSRIESVPVILSDAAKCCTSVIAMPVGDLKYIIEKYKIGIVAKKVSSEALKDAIILGLNNNPTDYHKNFENMLETFSVRASVKIFIKLIS